MCSLKLIECIVAWDKIVNIVTPRDVFTVAFFFVRIEMTISLLYFRFHIIIKKEYTKNSVGNNKHLCSF